MIIAADIAEPSKLELVLQYVVAPAIPLLCAGLLGALAKLATYLHAKEGESKAARVGAVVADAARSVVAELEVTLKPQLEAALADGKLTDAALDAAVATTNDDTRALIKQFMANAS